ncbi:hypothetical protein C8R44DRAFT_894167 [Mycena epipterygia]|nr:hypothetical protein C8R44DRAFT_894167 [Mycena epipterygia]
MTGALYRHAVRFKSIAPTTIPEDEDVILHAPIADSEDPDDDDDDADFSRGDSLHPSSPTDIPHISVTTADIEAYRVDLELYRRDPDRSTICTHPDFDLPACGIVVNERYHIVTRSIADTSQVPPPIFGLSLCQQIYHFCARAMPTAVPAHSANLTKIPLSLPERDQDLGCFAHREGWLELVEGLTPQNISDAVRLSNPDDGDLDELKKPVIQYIHDIQPELKKYASFGMQRLIAKVGDSESLAGFNRLQPSSCDNYGRTLWRLVFNLFRQIRGELPEYHYPLTSLQEKKLKDLDLCLKSGSSEELIDLNIHRTIHATFSHKKRNNKEDKFFSCVNHFIVLFSFHESGELHPATTITSNIAHLMYSNRATQMSEMRRLMDEDPELDIYGVYDLVKVYLQDMQETPFAYLVNVFFLLRIIGSNEHSTKDYPFTSADSRVIAVDGKDVSLDGFTIIMDNLKAEFDELLALDFKLHRIADNTRNKSPGYCFLDDPDNVFRDWTTAYGEWLLSDRKPRRNALISITASSSGDPKSLVI